MTFGCSWKSDKKTVIHLCSFVLLVYNNGFSKSLFKLLYLCSQRKVNNWRSLKEIDFMSYEWKGTVTGIRLCVQVSVWQRRTEESWCGSLDQDVQPESGANPNSCPNMWKWNTNWMNRWFLLQILLLAQHVSGTTMPVIRSSRVLYRWSLPVLFGALVFKLSVWCGAEGYVSGLWAAQLST